LQISGEPVVVRLTTTDVPVSPPIVATETTDLDLLSGYTPDTVNGASVNGVRTPMELTGRAEALPMVGNNGGLSDLTAALREYGDQATNIPITHLMVAAGTPQSVLDQVRKQGVSLADDSAHAAKVRAELVKLPFLRDVQYAQELNYPTLDVAIDRERAGQFGLSMTDVSRSIVPATSSSRCPWTGNDP
jgi:multidrug efflux pump subunit AcrB